jgi:hypothetical protein
MLPWPGETKLRHDGGNVCAWCVRIDFEIEWIGTASGLPATELSATDNVPSCLEEAASNGYARAMIYNKDTCLGIDFDTVMKAEFVRDATECDLLCDGDDEECGGALAGTVYDLAG